MYYKNNFTLPYKKFLSITDISFTMNFDMTHLHLFEKWLGNKGADKSKSLLKYVIEVIGKDVDVKKLQQFIWRECCKFESKWAKENRTKKTFLQKHSKWLSQNIDFSEYHLDVRPTTSNNKRGRPSKRFSDSSDKTQVRKVRELTQDIDPNYLMKATELLLISEGKRDTAKIVHELVHASPSRGTCMKKAILSVKKPKRISADKALAAMIDGDQSSHQYQSLREHFYSFVPGGIPHYNTIKKTKQLCYPDKITVTEEFADIHLQSLMDHTVKRLCAAQN